MEALLSIVIPSYNRYDYLSECLKSAIVFSQDMGERSEVVVLDNHSTDERYLKMEKKYGSSVRLIRNSYNVGGNMNIIRSAAVATGKYLLIIGDDDGIGSRLKEVCAALEQYEPDFVFFTKNRGPNTKDGEIVNARNYISELLKDPLSFNYLSHITSIIHRREHFNFGKALLLHDTFFPHFTSMLHCILSESGKELTALVMSAEDVVLPSEIRLTNSEIVKGIGNEWTRDSSGKVRPKADSGLLEDTFECQVQSSLFTIWCDTFRSLVDDTMKILRLRSVYISGICKEFTGAKEHLDRHIIYGKGFPKE